VTKSKSQRPKLPPISEQVKTWSAALEAEIGDWPAVQSRSFFGFAALYRRDKIFALLPRTRGMQTANSLAFKLESPGARLLARLQQDHRVGSTQMQKARWFSFELTSDADLHDALDWLARAYEAAGETSKR
jgi:predicted DNA-binding protein (MmcQ/YjbR family)